MNSELFEVALVTVTLDPLAVSVPVRLLFAPTVIEPKLKVDGAADNWPGAALPPDNPILRVGFGASDAMAILPLELPEDCGAKVTVKVALCPAFRVAGMVSPLMLKSEPVAIAEEILTALPPVFVTVSETFLLDPA